MAKAKFDLDAAGDPNPRRDRVGPHPEPYEAPKPVEFFPPPDTTPQWEEDQRKNTVEVMDLLELVAEKAKRKIEALKLYEPLPVQREFHDCPAKLRLIRGSNRSGKTASAAVEFARAVTGNDPLGRYPKENGRGYIVGKDQSHHGEVTYRKLFHSGAFKMIRDEQTREWRAYRPWDASDKARAKEAKPAPPLIPPRTVKSIAWDKKNKGIPAKVKLVNGWEINFLSSLGKPPQGMDIDLVWFDEEIVDSDWFPEMSSRLLDREGYFFWSATPQAGSERLLELHIRCEAEMEQFKRGKGPPPDAREFVVLLKDNPHISDDAKRLMEASLTDAEKLVRVDGEFAIHGRKIFPEFRKAVHCVKYFDIPHHWTNYLIVDPGRQVCAVLLAAVAPPGEYRGQEFACVVRDERYIVNSDAHQFAKETKSMVDGLRLEAMVIDIHGARITEMGSGKTVIEQYQDELEEAGVGCVRSGSKFEWGCDDVKAGVEAFRRWLRVNPGGNPILAVIEDKCPNFLWEIERYRYKMKDGEVTDEPETRGKVHLMSCARYLVMCDPTWVSPAAAGASATGAYAVFLQRLRQQRAASGPPAINFGPARR